MAQHVFFRFHIKERGTAEQREKAIGNMVGLYGSVPGNVPRLGINYRDPMTLRHQRRPVCCAT
jgi:hypothetical protein